MAALKKTFVERAKKSFDPKMLERLGIMFTDEQKEAFITFLACALQHNKSAELIPQAEEEQIFPRHFCDAVQLILLFGFKRGATVLDIGSNGGFPILPVNIMRPDLTFIVVESQKKKIEFLEEASATLGFNNVIIVQGKPETVKIEHDVDYVVTRMPWSLQKYSQLARRFLTSGGYMYMYKNKPFPAELELLTENRSKDGIKIGEIAQYDVGNLNLERYLVSMMVM